MTSVKNKDRASGKGNRGEDIVSAGRPIIFKGGTRQGGFMEGGQIQGGAMEVTASPRPLGICLQQLLLKAEK